FPEMEGNRFIGHEKGLGGHDGAAGAALGQFILGALPGVGVTDFRHDQQVHEPLYKGGFPRADRPDDAEVDAAPGALGDVLKELELFHGMPSPVAGTRRGLHPWGPAAEAWVPRRIAKIIWTRHG